MPGGAAEDVPVCLILRTASVTAIEKKKTTRLNGISQFTTCLVFFSVHNSTTNLADDIFKKRQRISKQIVALPLFHTAILHHTKHAMCAGEEHSRALTRAWTDEHNRVIIIILSIFRTILPSVWELKAVTKAWGRGGST